MNAPILKSNEIVVGNDYYIRETNMGWFTGVVHRVNILKVCSDGAVLYCFAGQPTQCRMIDASWLFRTEQEAR